MTIYTEIHTVNFFGLRGPGFSNFQDSGAAPTGQAVPAGLAVTTGQANWGSRGDFLISV